MGVERAGIVLSTGRREDMTQVLRTAHKIRNLNSVSGREWEDAYTAGSERHAVIVLLLWVQHAQGYCQLPFAVCYDGKGQ